MNHPKHPLLSIGSFASAARLSLKALRLYDRLDICKPSYVAPESGYRYYQVTQLRDARLIRMMRQMEIPLATLGNSMGKTCTAFWRVRFAQRGIATTLPKGRWTKLQVGGMNLIAIQGYVG